MPPLQKVRSDQLSQDIIEAIHAAARRHCPTSPCMKDECRRRLGKGHWESARAMFRHDTWNEYWAWFCEDSPAIASKIASKEYPDEAPRAFRDHQPWYLRDKGGDSCLCMSCEAMQKKMAAASRAAALLRELLDSLIPVEATDRALAEEGGVAAAEEGGSNSTAGDATSGGLPVAALNHLAQLVRILEAPSKGQMCLESTCGDKGPGAKLESRAEACCNGSCPDCGFRKHWTSGLREFLIDRVEEADGVYEGIKEDVPQLMFETLHWGNYAYRLKEENRNVQGRGRGGSRELQRRSVLTRKRSGRKPRSRKSSTCRLDLAPCLTFLTSSSLP